MAHLAERLGHGLADALFEIDRVENIAVFVGRGDIDCIAIIICWTAVFQAARSLVWIEKFCPLGEVIR